MRYERRVVRKGRLAFYRMRISKRKTWCQVYVPRSTVERQALAQEIQNKPRRLPARSLSELTMKYKNMKVELERRRSRIMKDPHVTSVGIGFDENRRQFAIDVGVVQTVDDKTKKFLLAIFTKGTNLRVLVQKPLQIFNLKRYEGNYPCGRGFEFQQRSGEFLTW